MHLPGLTFQHNCIITSFSPVLTYLCPPLFVSLVQTQKSLSLPPSIDLCVCALRTHLHIYRLTYACNNYMDEIVFEVHRRRDVLETAHEGIVPCSTTASTGRMPFNEDSMLRDDAVHAYT